MHFVLLFRDLPLCGISVYHLEVFDGDKMGKVRIFLTNPL